MLFLVPLQVADISLNISSVAYTYLNFVEPQLVELGLIRRKSLDSSEY